MSRHYNFPDLLKKFVFQVKCLRSSFCSGKTRDMGFRLKQLSGLLRMYEEREDEILHSLYQDMRKSRLEAYLYEVDLMKNECREAIKVKFLHMQKNCAKSL